GMPIKSASRTGLLVRDVARVRAATMLGEFDRYNMKRLVSVTANIQGEDLGRVDRHIRRALQAAGEPPRGATVEVRGQIEPMRQMLGGLTGGLLQAVGVFFLLMHAVCSSVSVSITGIY